MALTITQICNLALSHLGTYTISDYESDNSEEGRQCRILYEPARDQVLSDFPWNFAERREDLSLLADITPTGYEYAYQYPTDCVHAREIYRSTTGVDPIDFIVTANEDLDSRMILTDEEDAVLIYTAAISNTALHSPGFNILLGWRMAADLSIPLTGKMALHDRMLNQYLVTLKAAQARNAKEGRVDGQALDNRYVSARS